MEALGPQLFGAAAQVLSYRTKHALLNCHLPMQIVVDVETTQSLNRNPVQHDALCGGVDRPARNLPRG